MKHDFKTSLAKGQQGEQLLMSLWPDLIKLDGFRSDFRLKSTGQFVELKSDQYDMQATPNFFIELWSDYDKKKRGGPYQALEHNSELWCYFFPKNKTLFVFDTRKLVSYLNKCEALPLVPIYNKGWVTMGAKISRKALEGLYEIRQF